MKEKETQKKRMSAFVKTETAPVELPLFDSKGNASSSQTPTDMDKRRHEAGKCEGLPQCWYCQDERTGEFMSRSLIKHWENER